MGRTFVKKITGEVKRMYVPTVNDNGTILKQSEVNLLCIELETEDGMVKVIDNLFSKLCTLIIGDTVEVDKYITTGTYSTYLKELADYINLYHSSLNNEQKALVYDKYKYSDIEYNENPKSIMLYGIALS